MKQSKGLNGDLKPERKETTNRRSRSCPIPFENRQNSFAVEIENRANKQKGIYSDGSILIPLHLFILFPTV